MVCYLVHRIPTHPPPPPLMRLLSGGPERGSYCENKVSWPETEQTTLEDSLKPDALITNPPLFQHGLKKKTERRKQKYYTCIALEKMGNLFTE